MRLLVDIGHPAQVHLFKNLIWSIKDEGGEVKITTRTGKDVILQLLKSYGLDHSVISTKGSGLLANAEEMVVRTYRIARIAREFRPDFMLSVIDPSMAQASRMLGIPNMAFIDSEPEAIKSTVNSILDAITLPFTDAILTLSSVRHDYGKKEVRVNSYKELAYLHPNQFTPDTEVIRDAGISRGEEYVLLRFVGWDAYHDAGRNGLSMESKMKLVRTIEEYASVFISSESPLPENLKRYSLRIRPEKMHDLLYYAKMLACDSQTMTTEAGILGTPAIRCNSFVGENDMGNFIELEQKYGVIFNFKDSDKAISRAEDLLLRQDLKKEWREKSAQIIKDKIDLTLFMKWLIEGYPDSVAESRENPGIQYIVGRKN